MFQFKGRFMVNALQVIEWLGLSKIAHYFSEISRKAINLEK
jgi:hypothetical protein